MSLNPNWYIKKINTKKAQMKIQKTYLFYQLEFFWLQVTKYTIQIEVSVNVCNLI